MKIKSTHAVLFLPAVVFLAAVSSRLFAQPKDEHKLVQFQMSIVRKGPNWSDDKSVYIRPLQQHLDYLNSLIGSGKAVIAGPLADTGRSGIVSIIIFRASSTEEAKAWADTDPAVKAGFTVHELHPWWSEDIFKPADMPLTPHSVYLAFLKKGPNRKEGDDKNPEIQELQKRHIANIERLAAEHKLVVAGPFGDDSELRGIFVFRAGSLKEAQDLAATDPMVKIDRLRLEFHPWQVPLGVIP